MARLITQVDPLEAAKLRAQIAGQAPPLGGAKAPKAPPKPKQTVSQFHSWKGDHHLIQLPEVLEQPPRRVKPPHMTDRGWQFFLRKRDQEYIELRERVAAQVWEYLPQWADEDARARLCRIEYVRISPLGGTTREMDDDNLVACFKAVRDAVCVVAQHGPAWAYQDRRAIGHADGFLKRRGVTWTYGQQQCAANKRAYGIQIKLYV